MFVLWQKKDFFKFDQKVSKTHTNFYRKKMNLKYLFANLVIKSFLLLQFKLTRRNCFSIDSHALFTLLFFFVFKSYFAKHRLIVCMSGWCFNNSLRLWLTTKIHSTSHQKWLKSLISFGRVLAWILCLLWRTFVASTQNPRALCRQMDLLSRASNSPKILELHAFGK